MPPEFPADGLAPLEAEIEVAAPVGTVWGLLSDLRSMSERSPETVRMFISGAPQVGSRGVNINRKGAVVWPTTTRVTQWKPPGGGAGLGVPPCTERSGVLGGWAANDTGHDGTAALAFHVGPTNVQWSYELTPTAAGGTRVVERRTGLARANVAVRLTGRWLLGGAEQHDVELLDGMHRTLAVLKSEAEAAADPA